MCRIHPEAKSIIEIGGHTSKFLVLAGGCARNAGVVRAFREIVSAESQVSKYPGLEAAIGAALVAQDATSPTLSIAAARRWVDALLGERAQRREALPPLTQSPDAHRRPEPQQTHHVPVTAYLGIDVRSVSSDLVLLDREGRVISSVYLATRGRPVDVLLEGFERVRARFPEGLHIVGCGATGSGRYLAAQLLNADVVRNEKPSFRSFECHHCSNRCEVNILTVGGERAFFGDTCERYTERGVDVRSTGLPPNLAEEYVARCEAAFASGEPRGLKIGIPRGSTLFESLPFWAAFFRTLGHQPILSEPSSEATLTLGLKHLSVGVCLPIKLTAGHVQALIRRGVHLVFLPSIVVLPGDDPSHSYSCPYAMAVPFIVSSKRGTRLFSPVVSMQDEESFLDSFEPYAELLSANRTRMHEAWEAGKRAEGAIDAEFRERAASLLADGVWSRAGAILGKPYNTFDGYLNLSLFERLRRLGVLAIPQKFLPGNARGDSVLPWRFSADMELSAAALASSGPVYPILVSNFGCGPDAFSFGQIEEALGEKPHRMLEFDEHRGEAGLITRLEAFLDQLDAVTGEVRAEVLREPAPAEAVPPKDAVVRIPYFADHAHAFSGLLRLQGCGAAGKTGSRAKHVILRPARVATPPPGILTELSS